MIHPISRISSMLASSTIWRPTKTTSISTNCITGVSAGRKFNPKSHDQSTRSSSTPTCPPVLFKTSLSSKTQWNGTWARVFLTEEDTCCMDRQEPVRPLSLRPLLAWWTSTFATWTSPETVLTTMVWTGLWTKHQLIQSFCLRISTVSSLRERQLTRKVGEEKSLSLDSWMHLMASDLKRAVSCLWPRITERSLTQHFWGQVAATFRFNLIMLPTNKCMLCTNDSSQTHQRRMLMVLPNSSLSGNSPWLNCRVISWSIGRTLKSASRKLRILWKKPKL